MAVKSKSQTTPKKQPAAKKTAPKKSGLNVADVVPDDEEDDMMELEDDESIAPVDQDEEMVDETAKPAKKTKQAKGKSPAKEGKGAEPKEKKGKKVSTAPTEKQTNGTKKSSDLGLKAKESRINRLQRTICVKHLRPNHTDEDIVEFFASAGKVTVVKRVRSKALAMVMLESVKKVEKAIGLNGKQLNGHAVVVERSKYVGMERVLKEKKKLRSKKKRLERKNKKAEQEAAGAEKKETAAKGQKKNKTNKKEDGGKSKKQAKGKDVAEPAAKAPKSKPAKSPSKTNGAAKAKETKGKKVTK